MGNPKLSIVMPVYNEKNTVLEILERVKKVAISKEIIVIDNCSTDGTRELLRNAQGIDRLILQEKNMGKGNSVRAAIPYLNGEFMVIQDGDLEYNPESFHDLIETAEKNGYEAVYGSRLREGVIRTRYMSYYAGVKFLNFAINVLFGSNLSDAATTYKLIRVPLVKKLKLHCLGFDLDFELTCKILKTGVKIVEIPIPYTPRSFKEGKKIRAVDGFKALCIILKSRFFD